MADRAKKADGFLLYYDEYLAMTSYWSAEQKAKLIEALCVFSQQIANEVHQQGYIDQERLKEATDKTIEVTGIEVQSPEFTVFFMYRTRIISGFKGFKETCDRNSSNAKSGWEKRKGKSNSNTGDMPPHATAYS